LRASRTPFTEQRRVFFLGQALLEIGDTDKAVRYLRGESFWVNLDLIFFIYSTFHSAQFPLGKEKNSRDFYILVAPCLVQPNHLGPDSPRPRAAPACGGCGLSLSRRVCAASACGSARRRGSRSGFRCPARPVQGGARPRSRGPPRAQSAHRHRGSCRGSNSQVTVSPCVSRVCWSSSASPAQLSLRAAVSPGPARHNDRVTARRSRPSGAQLWVVLLLLPE
jgi:hypothetical protein